jgi:hypothetical protein
MDCAAPAVSAAQRQLATAVEKGVRPPWLSERADRVRHAEAPQADRAAVNRASTWRSASPELVLGDER